MKFASLILTVLLLSVTASAKNWSGLSLACGLAMNVQVPSKDVDVRFEDIQVKIPNTEHLSSITPDGRAKVEYNHDGFYYYGVLNWGNTIVLQLRDSKTSSYSRYMGPIQFEKDTDEAALTVRSTRLSYKDGNVYEVVLFCHVVPTPKPEPFDPSKIDDRY